MQLKILISVALQCLRSAAKNHQYVAVVVDPADYEKVINDLKRIMKLSLKHDADWQQKYSVILQHMIRLFLIYD